MRAWGLILPERHRPVAAAGATDLVVHRPRPPEPCPGVGLVHEQIAR